MENNKPRGFPAIIVKVINNSMVAINRGKDDGLKIGEEFAIYGLSDERITDPESGEDLGLLEIFKGKGQVINLQEKMATIESIEKKKARKEIIESNPNNQLLISFPRYYGSSKKVVEFPPEDLPFNHPKVGDKAKPI